MGWECCIPDFEHEASWSETIWETNIERKILQEVLGRIFDMHFPSIISVGMMKSARTVK
jgi:hypothetical protein